MRLRKDLRETASKLEKWGDARAKAEIKESYGKNPIETMVEYHTIITYSGIGVAYVPHMLSDPISAHVDYLVEHAPQDLMKVLVTRYALLPHAVDTLSGEKTIRFNFKDCLKICECGHNKYYRTLLIGIEHIKKRLDINHN